MSESTTMEMDLTAMQELSDGNIYIGTNIDGNYSAVIQKVGKEEVKFGRKCDLGEVKVIHCGDGSKKIMEWGKNNQLPMMRERLIQENNIVPTLISTKRNLVIGSGVYCYQVKSDGKEIWHEYVEKPDAISNFLRHINHRQYFRRSAGDLMLQANVFTEFIWNKKGEITSMHHKAAKYMRAQEQNSKGEIDNYFWKGSWANEKEGKSKIKHKAVRIPAYRKDKKHAKSIFHGGDDLIHNGYYCVPTYWGSKKWITLANCIPEFHLANLKHGYTLRYHIRIPKDYFLDARLLAKATTKSAKKECIDKAKTAEKQFVDRMNNFLAGINNAGRAVFTKYDFSKTLAKEFPGIQILPINADLKDKALLELFDKSNDAVISSQALHPSLSNVQSEGKLSSGSEMRNALLTFLFNQSVNREILLEPLNIVRHHNNWDDLPGFGPEVKFGFRDQLITTLDESKTGKKSEA